MYKCTTNVLVKIGVASNEGWNKKTLLLECNKASNRKVKIIGQKCLPLRDT